MKKVKVKYNIEKSKPIFTKRFYFILIGVGIILLMIGSVLQFGNDEEVADNVVKYNDYIFNNVNNKWILNINENNIPFDFLPDDVKGLYLDNVKFGTKVYIAVDPSDNINKYFIQRIKAILQYKGILGIESCIKEEGCSDIPLVNCSIEKDIILIKKGNTAKVYKDSNCLVLEGNNEGLIEAVDLLYYKLLGVL